MSTLRKSIVNGFSVPLIVVGIGILVLLFIYFSSSNKTSEKTDQAVQPVRKETGFEKVEDKFYVFYYPKGYISGESGESERGQKDVLKYTNPDNTSENILLRIENTNRKEATIPTFEDCKKFAEKFRQKQDNEITAEVARGGLDGATKGVGCKTVVKLPVKGTDDAVMLVDKFLFDSQVTPITIYSVRATYFAHVPKNEAEALDLAVDQFGLR
ncbi:hypothetical protein HY383_01325 [Candidatus Daviesbacteria bacterium]|nr:hypothetical protein [Candidatus Daviesbacteria bacterium]